MQIILLEKVGALGQLGDVVKVRGGFARNYLIPSGKAQRATPKAIQEFENRRAELEKVQNERLAAARALGERLAGTNLRIAQKAGVDGRLFGSVTNADIADGLTKLGLEVDKPMVRMPDGQLKSVGEYTVEVVPHTDVVVEITVSVVAETA